MRKCVRRLLYGSIGAALLVPMLALFLVSAPPVAAQSGFTDADGRFSFVVPDGWEEDSPDDEEIVAQFQVTSPLGNFHIVAAPLPEGTTLDAYIPVALAQLKSGFEEFQPVGAHDTVLGGEAGKQFDFAAVTDGQKVALSQIYTVHEGTVYILTIATPAQNIRAVMGQATSVLASWQFLAEDA